MQLQCNEELHLFYMYILQGLIVKLIFFAIMLLLAPWWKTSNVYVVAMSYKFTLLLYVTFGEPFEDSLF